MLYTSYFAKAKNIKDPNTICVSISLHPPKWFNGLCYKKVSPTQQILDDWHAHYDEKNYKIEYEKQVISNLVARDIVLDLIKLTENKYDTIVLLCYETPDKFCHRHIVAEWLTKNGFPCKELEL